VIDKNDKHVSIIEGRIVKSDKFGVVRPKSDIYMCMYIACEYIFWPYAA